MAATQSIRIISTFGFLCIGLAGCGESTPTDGTPIAAGAGGVAAGTGGAGASGTGSSGAGTGGAALAGTGSGGAASCPAATPMSLKNDASVTLPVRFASNGQPLVTGQDATAVDGLVYKVALFKLFLAEPSLVRADGSEVRAVFVDASGSPLPYGLTLLDVEAMAPVLSLAAPAGPYTALKLGVGVPENCNGGDPTQHVFPLNADSDMYWTWGAAYLFLRLEGQMLTEGSWSSAAYHLGRLSDSSPYRMVTLSGSIILRAGGGAGPAIQLDIGKMIAPAPEGEPRGHVLSAPWVFDNIAGSGALSLVP